MYSQTDYYFNEETFTDINPLFVGMQKCQSLHSYGPRICPYTIIHYVLKGKGTVEQNGTVEDVSEGQIFIIFAGDIAKYTADESDPWEYMWIAYDGIYESKLRFLDKFVLSVERDIFENLHVEITGNTCNKYSVASLLYTLHGKYSDMGEAKDKHDYPSEVKKIIKLKYMQDISVAEIAKNLNIDKRYMSRIFKQRYGKTVIEYLIEVRMKRATELLRDGYSVADTATIVGYSDSFNFSKMFRKTMGTSPSEFRKTHRSVAL